MSMWIVRLPRLCSQVPRLRKRALKDKAPFVPDEVSECVMAVLVGDGWCATALPVVSSRPEVKCMFHFRFTIRS